MVCFFDLIVCEKMAYHIVKMTENGAEKMLLEMV